MRDQTDQPSSPAALPPQRTDRATVAWTLVVTGLAGFMASLDNLVVTIALPAIRSDLGGGIENLEWTVSAYTLTFAVLLMFGAALGDRFGRRRMFTIGLGLFTAASAAAASAPGIEVLVGARAAQGLGAAILMPLTLTLLTGAVRPERRGAVFGVWGAVNGLAVAAGPLVGGMLTEYLSWQWIFWVNVPVGLALLPLAAHRLKGSQQKAGRVRPLDLPGTVLATVGLFGIVFALIRGNGQGWTSAPIVGGLVGGGAFLVAFVGWEMRTAHPMLPMRLFRSRAFSAVNGAGLLMSFGMFGSIFLLSQFLQNAGGYSPMEAGLRMLLWTAIPMIVAPLAGVLSDRIGGRPVAATGLALQAAGLGLFAAVLVPDVMYVAMIPALVVSGFGMGLYFAPAAAMVMGSVRPEEQGIASGASNALREVGGSLGVAVLASVFSAQGGYTTPRQFVDGLAPALWVGAVLVAAAAVVTLTIPRSFGGRVLAQSPVDRLGALARPTGYGAPV